MPRFVVIGLGKTGLSCVKYLLEQGHDVTVCDTRRSPPGLDVFHVNYPDVPVYVGELSRAVIAEADTIVMSPGVPLDMPVLVEARGQGVPCIGDIELFVLAATAPIIAITGTNGKTTTTSLVGAMIKQAGFDVQMGGNIGEPVLNLLSQPTPDYYVLELSSFQLEATSSLKARVAVILNLSPDHMDRYAAFADYRRAKQRIYHHCQCAVVNADEPELWDVLALPEDVIRFSLGEQKADIQCHANQTLQVDDVEIDMASLTAQNRLHPQNVCVALAIGKALEMPLGLCCRAIEAFRSLPHRCQWIAKYQGVDWYNDSKATNADAVIAALSMVGSRHKRLVWIAGGDAKGSELASLIPMVSQYVACAYLIGQDAHQVEGICKAASVPATIMPTLFDAVNAARDTAQAGDAVILSPACASWDMYQNFEDRGEQFMSLVHRATHEATDD